jgi:hypothetical protein
MKLLIVFVIGIPTLWANTDRGITQEPTPESSYNEYYETTGKKASLVPPLKTHKPPLSETHPLSADTNWVPIDTFAFEQLIPHGEQYAVSFNYATRSLKDTLVHNFNFSALVASAIAKAPDWLKWDLIDQFSRLSTFLQEPFANLIVNCPDSRYLDEVCFQVAHLAPQTLNSIDPQLLIANAEWIYRIAPDLKYVKLVEFGNPAQGGNYSTTTKYQIKRNGNPIWVEIPKEIYYWWIVEPRCSDERPLMDASVYDKFWREYLYTYADSAYPLLKDVLAPVTVLWDESTHVWNNNGQDFGDSLKAIQAVGRWVAHTLPASAQDPRPIQPNQLLRDHNGNCGECQDLLCAGMRTALIPNISVMDINEDHVWNEIWWDGQFYENQIDLGGGVTHIADFGTSYDKDVGGSKECSCIWDWRADGYQFSSIMRYSKFCTLTVTVVDKNGKPIDGVNVNIDSKPWDAYPTMYGRGFAGATDRAGVFTTLLGNFQDYKLTLSSTFGTKSLGWVIDSADCIADAHFYIVDTLTNAEMPKLEVYPKTYPTEPDESYRLVIDYELPYEVVFGKEYTPGGSSNTYAFNKTQGAIDFFIPDPENLGRYLGDSSFQAYAIKADTDSDKVSFVVPTRENYYCVFSNRETNVVSEFVTGTAVLFKNTLAPVAENPGVSFEPLTILGAYPNPSRNATHIRYKQSQPGRTEFKIYDLRGSLVQTIIRDGKESGEQIAIWDVTTIPAGVYFYTARFEGRQLPAKREKIIVVK